MLPSQTFSRYQQTNVQSRKLSILQTEVSPCSVYMEVISTALFSGVKRQFERVYHLHHLLTALHRNVTLLRRGVCCTFKVATFGSEVVVFLLDSAHFCSQLIYHSFEKFGGLCDSTLQNALHHRGALLLEVVRRHLAVVLI